MSLQQKISSRIEAPGVCVQVVDYRWHRGTQIVAHEADHVLRRRAHPSQLAISALLGKAQQPFGHLMFFPADIPVVTQPAEIDENVQTITCRFDQNWFAKAVDVPHEWLSEDLERCLDLRNGRVDQAIQWMGQESAAPGMASALLIESLASVVAVELSRHFAHRDVNLRVRTREGKLLPSHLNRVIEYIESATHKCPTIDEIAAMCDVSSAHLRRAFKNTTGLTIHEYVETVRLNKARGLLSETDLPLKVISYQLGFAASSTFSSVFRKLQGETPSGFRCRTRH